jgi:hypothetical protein
MQTLSTQFESELKKLITAKIEEIKNNMVAGSYSGISDYAKQVGIVWAYRDVLGDLSDEANKILNER